MPKGAAIRDLLFRVVSVGAIVVRSSEVVVSSFRVGTLSSINSLFSDRVSPVGPYSQLCKYLIGVSPPIVVLLASLKDVVSPVHRLEVVILAQPDLLGRAGSQEHATLVGLSVILRVSVLSTGRLSLRFRLHSLSDLYRQQAEVVHRVVGVVPRVLEVERREVGLVVRAVLRLVVASISCIPYRLGRRLRLWVQ